jgi:hypothetical protein
VADVLAEKVFSTTALTNGLYTFTISNAFANTLDAGQSGPVYDVTPADIAYDNDVLTIVVAPYRSPLQNAWSVAEHGIGTACEELALPICEFKMCGGVSEPREFSADCGDISLRLQFDWPVSAGNVNVSGIPNLGTPVQVAPDTVEVPFTSDPGRGNYTITVDVGGPPQATLPYCYSVGDVTCDGLVTVADEGMVKNNANFGIPPPLAAALDPKADVSRDGLITVADQGVVKNNANFGTDISPCNCQ